jgi:hypothetical protein
MKATPLNLEKNKTAENQVREPRRGWQVVEAYCDNGISGAKGRDQRPAFDKLNKDAIHPTSSTSAMAKRFLA